MEIQDYVREKERRLAKGAGRLRDARVFDFNYIPERPLMREEIKPVIDALLRYERTGVANHMLIVGSRGSGKTVSVLYLRQLFHHRGLTILYANCRSYNTSYKILAHLLGVRARGVSFTELTERFTERYSEKTAVLLDEVDLLSEKDKSKDILYFLSRARGGYTTVLLSNNPRWAATLDESIQSTLQPELIYFRSYSPEELVRILQLRADTGISGATHGLLENIAALTAKFTNSDVRVGLKTLYYWATEPEVPLEENFQRARRDVVVDVVSNLNDRNLLILRAVAGGDRPVKEAYQRYRQLCFQHKEEPFSYVYFYSSLAYLQSLGLILLVSTKVRRTYTKVMQLTFPADILDTLWRLRFD